MDFYAKLTQILLEMDLVDYISTSKENVMSGATRAHRKEWRRVQKTGVGTEREGRTLETVPTTYKGYRRRARKAHNKGLMKKAVNAVFTKSGKQVP